MNEYDFTNILRFKNIKIKNENLIKQLSKDDLIYLHLHLMMKKEINDVFKDLEIPLSIEDFERAKKNVNIKRLNRDKLIEDILYTLKVDEGEENSTWFRTEIFEKPELAVEYSEFYILFYSLLSKQVCLEFEKIRTNTISEYTDKLSSLKNDNKAEYNCIKAMCAIYISDRYFKLKDRANSLCEDDNNKSIDSYILKLQNELAICVHNNYVLICADMIEEDRKTIDTLKSNLKNSSIQIEDKNDKIKELKDNLKQSMKQNKELQKMSDITNIENDIKVVIDKVKKIESSNSAIEKEIKNSRESILKQSYESQIESYITKLSTVQSNLMVKTSECKALKNELESFKNNIEENFIKFVEDNGLSEKMKCFLTPLLGVEMLNTNDSESEDIFVDNKYVDNDNNVTKKDSRRIGYVTIEEDKHFINFANGLSEEISGIGERVYLVEGQFVVVDENSKFVKTTASIYEDNGIPIRSLNIGVIESLDPLMVRVGFECINVRNNNGFVGIYNLKQVVALNEYNQIVRTFKMAKFNADTVMKSIKARGQEIFYVLDVFKDYLSLRNVETGEEDLHKINTGEFELSKGSVLFIKDGEIINVLAKSIFYTGSNYYKGNVEFGPVSLSGEITLLKKQNGEQVIVKNIPENYKLVEGQIVYVDEFNNFMYSPSLEKAFVEKNTLKKPLRQVVSTSENRTPKEIKGKIIIVGNPYYKNGYIAAFYKCGYRVKIMHGYDCNINNIMQEAKDCVGIIVNTSYCSHDNFWQIKDEVKDGSLKGLKYIFTQDDGANMLLNRFLNMEVESETAITN